MPQCVIKLDVAKCTRIGLVPVPYRMYNHTVCCIWDTCLNDMTRQNGLLKGIPSERDASRLNGMYPV